MAVTHKLAADETLELSLIGAIGDDWDEEPITAKAVKRALKDAPKASLIKVHIDSFGGSYFEGLAIYQLLSEHPARVEIEIGSCAASAASLIAMAGDSISMHETSTMLVHEVWTLAVGKASDLRKEADDLDLLSGQAAIAYSSRTGMTEEDVRSLMAEDRFMGAEECKKLGFCTEIRKAKPKGKSNSAPMTERHVRSQLAALRSEAEERASTNRLAASSPGPLPTTEEAMPPQETSMAHTAVISAILASLSLAETSTEDEAVTHIGALKADADAGKRILAAVGAKSADEAIGTIAAFQDAKNRLADTEAKLKDLEEKQVLAERTELIAKMRTDGKCSPAQEKSLFPTLSLESLRSFAETAVPLFSGDGKREPGKNGYQGKPYQDLTNAERAELKRTDPETFNQIRQQAINSGLL